MGLGRTAGEGSGCCGGGKARGIVPDVVGDGLSSPGCPEGEAAELVVGCPFAEAMAGEAEPPAATLRCNIMAPFGAVLVLLPRLALRLPPSRKLDNSRQLCGDGRGRWTVPASSSGR